MSATATTAPALAIINSFSTSNIEISAAGGLFVTVDATDTASNSQGSFRLRILPGGGYRVIYASNGRPTVDTVGISVAGAAAALLTAFLTAGGSLANRLSAVDTYLQTNGFLPS